MWVAMAWMEWEQLHATNMKNDAQNFVSLKIWIRPNVENGTFLNAIAIYLFEMELPTVPKNRARIRFV